MNARTLLRLGTILVLGAATLVANAQQPSPATSAEPVLASMDAGVQAYKSGRYEDAVADFRKAVALEPGNKQARLYLGTTYASQIVPNLATPENLKTAADALHEFDAVLKDDPHDLAAMRQEASIYRNINRLDQAKAREKEVIAADPRDAEALYTVGVIDWMQAYKNAALVLAREGLTDDGMGNPKLSNAGCDALAQQNQELVRDALASLTEAIRLKPNYDDAMQYLNLIYRRQADLHCEDHSHAAADLSLATQWSEHAMKARKANEVADTGAKTR